ncbi:L,D-transpeptidase [Bradyrhizobium tropiciagri]|uniref:L,D-transpeptidase n=1 Tax=Bradyrhizobium tropiciagri TaxID=312253 RepID=UPI00067C91C4|nr:L,D-transpeptidase [Bradyrhizobium tropiciagri]
MPIDRRLFLSSMPLVLSGCVSNGRTPAALVATPAISPFYASMYASLNDDRFPVPAIDLSEVDTRLLRREVDYRGAEPAGTIVVDPAHHYVYLVLGNGSAIRYGVGVGKAGLEFSGTAVVQYKREWPHWTPTPDMIRRDPDRYAKWAGGMDGGPDNPLGARALYLFKDGRDTSYRLHGTTESWSIGKSMSSGCIRFLNQDIIDLYSRVLVGSRVVVLSGRSA